MLFFRFFKLLNEYFLINILVLIKDFVLVVVGINLLLLYF